MIGSLINEYTSYTYDYKFYKLVDGEKFSFHETLFIYTVFFIDVFLLFFTLVSVLFLSCLMLAWLCGAVTLFVN